VGDKSDVSASLLPRLGRTTGLTIYNVNYRLSPVVTHPAHVHDLAAALAMLPADRDLVLMGHSCGSFLCTSLLFDTRLAAPAIASLRSRVVGLVASEPYVASLCPEASEPTRRRIWDPADLLAEYEDYRSFLEAAFGSTALLAAQSPPSHYALPPGATHRLRILVSHTREDELLSLRQPERLAAAVWTMGGREGTWTGERTFEAGGIEVVVDFDGVHGAHGPAGLGGALADGALIREARRRAPGRRAAGAGRAVAGGTGMDGTQAGACMIHCLCRPWHTTQCRPGAFAVADMLTGSGEGKEKRETADVSAACSQGKRNAAGHKRRRRSWICSCQIVGSSSRIAQVKKCLSSCDGSSTPRQSRASSA
jgi:hypothetical protein